MPAATSRINVNLSPESLEELKRLAQEAGIDMSEFVRNSVRVYGALKQETRNSKNKIYIGTDKKVDKEIILP